MKWPTCCYVDTRPECCDIPQLAGVVQQIHDQTFDVLDEGIDGHNVSEQFAPASGGLTWKWPRSPTGGWDKTKPKFLVSKTGDTSEGAYIHTKTNASGVIKGLEMVVNAGDVTYGRVCIVASSDLSKQIGSFIPDDPVTTASPKFVVRANYGKGVFGTSGAHDWELHRNGIASLSDNGSRIQVARPALTINGDSATDSRLKNTSTTFDIKLGDDSDYKDTDGGTFRARNGKYMKVGSGAGFEFSSSSGGSGTTDTGIFRASAGRAKVGTASGGTGNGGFDVSSLDLKGSTAFRTRLDPGTPTANKTITIPNRDLTMVGRAAGGTNDKLIRFDANGDAKDSGIEDNDYTIVIASRNLDLTGDAVFSGSATIKRPTYLYAEWTPNDTDVYTSDDLDEHNHLIINAGSLGGAGSATVNLPEAAIYDGLCIVIAIRVEGTGSDYITVQADVGQVTESGTDTIDATTRTYRKYMALAADNIWVRIG